MMQMVVVLTISP